MESPTGENGKKEPPPDSEIHKILAEVSQEVNEMSKHGFNMIPSELHAVHFAIGILSRSGHLKEIKEVRSELMKIESTIITMILVDKKTRKSWKSRPSHADEPIQQK